MSTSQLAPPVYLTVNETAELLHISRYTVVRRFAHEPGVVNHGTSETTKHARKYRELRIPQSVINRYLNRHTVK